MKVHRLGLLALLMTAAAQDVRAKNVLLEETHCPCRCRTLFKLIKWTARPNRATNRHRRSKT